MATPKQQKAWWALVKDDEAYAPTGQRLKDWLFGGAHIPTANALFDVDASGLAVVADLFGDEAYFADAEAFWSLQSAAMAEKVEAFRVYGLDKPCAPPPGAHLTVRASVGPRSEP